MRWPQSPSLTSTPGQIYSTPRSRGSRAVSRGWSRVGRPGISCSGCSPMWTRGSVGSWLTAWRRRTPPRRRSDAPASAAPSAAIRRRCQPTMRRSGRCSVHWDRELAPPWWQGATLIGRYDREAARTWSCPRVWHRRVPGDAVYCRRQVKEHRASREHRPGHGGRPAAPRSPRADRRGQPPCSPHGGSPRPVHCPSRHRVDTGRLTSASYLAGRRSTGGCRLDDTWDRGVVSRAGPP